MFDIKKVQEEAQKEVMQERIDKAKGKIKQKLREVAASEQILANHKRELEDLYAELSQST